MARTLLAALLLAAALALPAALAPARAQGPAADQMYTVELCCDLCARAASRSAYNTRFLQGFTVLMQGEDQWLFRSDDDLRTRFGPNADGLAGVRRLRGALKARGIDLVLAYVPPRGLIHAERVPRSARYDARAARASYDAALQRFRDAGLVVPDMRPLFEGSDAEPFYFRGDTHWTPHGARRMAAVVAAAIKSLPSYATLPKKSFVTARAGMMAKRGALQRAATEICGFGYPDQYVEKFVTAADGDPLATGSAPPVALMGTSNGDADYNFSGFLSEQLGVDVLNASIDGGGYAASLQNYLASAEFQREPPKVLVWELEPFHNLSNRSFWRQVVPLAGNGCRSSRPILKGRTELRSTSTEVLFNGGGQVLPLASRNHLIDLQFSDPRVRELDATIWYTNGSKEHYRVESSQHAAAGGRFVFELRSEPDWADRTFLSLDLTRPESVPAGVQVDAQLCARRDAAAPAAKRPKKGKKRHG